MRLHGRPGCSLDGAQHQPVGALGEGQGGIRYACTAAGQHSARHQVHRSGAAHLTHVPVHCGRHRQALRLLARAGAAQESGKGTRRASEQSCPGPQHRHLPVTA